MRGPRQEQSGATQGDDHDETGGPKRAAPFPETSLGPRRSLPGPRAVADENDGGRAIGSGGMADGPTAEQRAVIDAPIDAGTLVLAGPGTGKTYTLILRLERMLTES